MKIGIIGAMDVEVALLREHMKTERVEQYAGMTFQEGTLGGTPVVVVKSGICKVNAALCVQLLVDHFAVTQVMNTGIAGSLNREINIGDIVVSTSARYHDVDATVFGYQPGEIPQQGIVSFPADEKLQEAAAEAVEKAAPEVRVFRGQIVSGDQFISSKEKKLQLMRDFPEGLCCEMEGTAIAQAAFVNQIPFVILRAISDKADESAEESYDVFEKKAAQHCAAIAEYMVAHLA